MALHGQGRAYIPVKCNSLKRKGEKKKKINRCSAYICTNKKTSGVTSSEPDRANVFQILLDLLHEFAR